MQQFKLVPAEIADIPDIVTIFHDAFSTDAVVSQLEANVERGAKIRRTEQWYKTQFEHSHLTGVHVFKVVDTSNGNMAAFAKWMFPITLTAEQKAEKKAWEEEIKSWKPLEGSNMALRDDFLGQLAAKREVRIDTEHDYFLHILATARAYHRRGCGSLLLADGLARADKDGAKTYIEASRMGYPLYLRHGWEDVDEVVVDLEKHGIGEGLYIEKCLMRPPRSADVRVEAKAITDSLPAESL